MTTGKTMQLAGIWAAITTPFMSNGDLDLDGIRSNATHFGEALNLDGVFCHGIMGEGWSLTLDERQTALEALVDGGGGKLPVGVVVTHHALRETLALARHAGRTGAHHAVLMRPRGPYGDEELIGAAQAVADAAGLPLVLFESNAPGMSFGPGVIASLASAGDLIGIKATGGTKSVKALRALVGEQCTVCDPHEEQWLSALLLDPDTPLYADPEPYVYQRLDQQLIRAYQQALQAGTDGRALAIWRQLQPLREVYNHWIIGALDRGQSPAAALKHWMQRLGLAAGPVRAPLKPLSEDAKRRLDAALDACGLRAPPTGAA